MKIMPIDVVIKNLYLMHKDLVKILPETYNGASNKASFIDAEYGIFVRKVYIVLKGKRHPAFGKKHAVKNRTLTKEDFDRRLPSDVTIDFATYERFHQKAKFIDNKYGEFWARPCHVLRGHGHPLKAKEKAKATFIKKYGTDNPMKVKEIKRRVESSAKNAFIRFHWKTNELLTCTASFEARVVDFLNENKIDYVWQPDPFLLPDGSVYYIDLYIKDTDTWVEIKGWFRSAKSRAKWEWFHSNFKNSELWDKQKLISLGINIKAKIK